MENNTPKRGRPAKTDKVETFGFTVRIPTTYKEAFEQRKGNVKKTTYVQNLIILDCEKAKP